MITLLEKEVVDLGVQESNFDKSLKQGQKAEEFIKKLFENKGYIVRSNRSKTVQSLSEWDLLVSKNGKVFSIEVKNDTMSKKTGNVGFEVGQGADRKPSCLLTSKSDYWCHIFYTEEKVGISLCKTDYLRQLILTKNFYKGEELKLRFVERCGDNNSDMLLCSVEDFEKHVKGKILNISYKEAERKGLL